MIKSRRDGRDK